MAGNLPTSFLGWVFYIIQNYGGLFVKGALYTLVLAIIGTVVGCIIGFFVGIIRTIVIGPDTKKLNKIFLRFVQWIFSFYVEFFRGTPMIVQAMVIYYGSMQLFNIDMSPFSAGLLVVSINTGAYMAETVRGGIEAIDIGQTEGAKAIGMTHFQTMLYIIIKKNKQS